MNLSGYHPEQNQEPILTADQQHVCERLLSIARVRAGTTEPMLPIAVLNRWSIPLLIGPAGSGKTFVCHEVARRWCEKPCRRWEVGSWMTATNRASNTTTEQIRTYVQDNPQGCVVYLAGIDALAVPGAHNASYNLSVSTEVAQLLERVSKRPPSLTMLDGTTFPVNALVVVGGCFGRLWGDAGIAGTESWKFADPDPLSEADAAGKWLLKDSGLPADILRRLAPEPLIINRIDREEADRLAVRLRDCLPPSLDGLSADEFSVALRSLHGWRAVANTIERAWVDGHERLPLLDESPTIAPPVAPKPKLAYGLPLPKTQPLSLRPIRLGARLGIPWAGTPLQRKTRRLELPTVWHLEWLAVSRGFTLPGESYNAEVRENVSRHKFSDVELAAALLSPFLEARESAVCRGAFVLRTLIDVADPESIAHQARQARGEAIVRHVAQIGHELQPEQRRWHDLVRLLPATKEAPPLPPRIMPDEAIRSLLAIVEP